MTAGYGILKSKSRVFWTFWAKVYGLSQF